MLLCYKGEFALYIKDFTIAHPFSGVVLCAIGEKTMMVVAYTHFFGQDGQPVTIVCNNILYCEPHRAGGTELTMIGGHKVHVRSSYEDVLKFFERAKACGH